MCLISNVVGMITFLLLSLPTIISTIPAFRWPFCEALYGRRCKSPVGWFEVGEEALIGPNSVVYAMEKVQLIRDRLNTTQSHQKSYANVRRRELEFQVGD